MAKGSQSGLSGLSLISAWSGLGLPSALFESYDQLRRNVAQEFGLQRAQVGFARGIDVEFLDLM
jgi:hypothetical protein